MRRYTKEYLEYQANKVADNFIATYSKQATSFARLVGKKIREKRERVRKKHDKT